MAGPLVYWKGERGRDVLIRPNVRDCKTGGVTKLRYTDYELKKFSAIGLVMHWSQISLLVR